MVVALNCNDQRENGGIVLIDDHEVYDRRVAVSGNDLLRL